MKNEKISILDLGSHKIKLLVISLNNNNYIDIHAKCSINSSGIKKGDIVDIDKLRINIKSIIDTVEKELGVVTTTPFNTDTLGNFVWSRRYPEWIPAASHNPYSPIQNVMPKITKWSLLK